MSLACITANVHSQILVGAGGVGPITFTAEPPLAATEWATTNITAGNAATYKTPDALDTAVQGFDALSIQTPLARTNAIVTARIGQHHTNNTYIYTQPTGVPVEIIKATLRNNSGGDLSAITVSYNYSVITTPVTDEIPGQRVFYSFTGAPSSWTRIDAFSGKTATALLTAGIEFGSPWVAGTDLYILWFDDNNETGTDGGFALDNFTVAPGLPPCPGITNQPTNVAITNCTVNSVSFSIGATGAVSTVQWYRNDVAISGANAATYTLTPVGLSDSGAQFYAVITGGSGPSCTSTSSVATLTVNPDTIAPFPVAALTYDTRTNRAANTLTNITIVFNENVDTNNNDLWTNWTLTDTNTGTQVPLLGQIYPNSRTVLLETDSASGGILDPTHGYTLEMQLVFDTCANNEMALTNIPVKSFSQTVIAQADPGTIWRFNESNVDLGVAWRAPGYDDSGWTNGAGPFDAKKRTGGFPGSCGERTTIAGEPIRTCLSLSNAAGTAEIPTYYFRKQFNYEGDTNAVLQLRSILDDGMVVYLNGAELFRFGMPLTGTIGFTTPANRTVGDGTKETNYVAATLLNGINTIAVEVHNVNLTGSDITFDLGVDVVTATPSAVEPVMSISQSGGTVTVTWAPPVGTLQRSLDISSPANWVTIPGASSPFVTNAPPAIQFFRVTVP